MKRLLALTLCLGLANAASAQILSQDFEGVFPPAGWQVFDNVVGASETWQRSDYFFRGNVVPNGTGFSASADSDWDSTVTYDTELWTQPFDLPASPGKFLIFDHYYNELGCQAQVDITLDGGTTWTNLVTYVGADDQGQVMLDLSAYAGSTGVMIRFWYRDNGNWAWWWQLDNVEVGDPPPPPYFGEDFDSGTWPPAGWTVVNNGTNVTAAWNTIAYWNALYGYTRYSNYIGRQEAASADCGYFGSAVHVLTELHTPLIDLPATPAMALTFGNENAASGPERGMVDVSMDGGLTWTNLATYPSLYPTSSIIDLTPYAGMTGLTFRFNFDSNNGIGWVWMIDDVKINPGPPIPDPPCNFWGEDFEGGVWPPAGWNVVDNTTTGQVWQLSTAFPRGNMCPSTNPYGGGDCAALDSDFYGSGNTQDSELWSAPFDIPGPNLKLIWQENYYRLGDTANVDISLDGGTTWTNLASYTTSNGGFSPGDGSMTGVSLDAFAGATGAILRWHYVASYDWWWMFDDLYMVMGASATVRTGGFNPTVYSVSGPPVMGSGITMDVDPSLAGHAYAQVFGYAGPFNFNLGFQKLVLVDFTGPELLALPALPGPVQYAITVPTDCLFAGYSLSTQAAIFTIMPPPIPWALTNAVDLVVGY